MNAHKCVTKLVGKRGESADDFPFLASDAHAEASNPVWEDRRAFHVAGL